MSKPTIAQVEAAFRKWHGFREGPRRNECPFNDWYYGKKVWGAAYPWCATFSSYVLFHAGIPIPATTKKGFAYTPSGANYFKQRGQWTRTPTVGALVFFHWESMGRIAHVGWVSKVNPDGSFLSWEGNTNARGSRTGGAVELQHRSAASIGRTGGFGLIEYGSSSSAPKPGDGTKKEINMFLAKVNGHTCLFEGGGIAVHVDTVEDVKQLKAAGIPELPETLDTDFAASHMILWDEAQAQVFWSGVARYVEEGQKK